VVVDPNLRAQHLRHYVRLTIEDSGPSLNGQAIEDLFEPSWDCNPSRPPGIGLFTVRNMIAAANGHFSIESDFPAGARFVLLFPESEAELLPEDRNGMSVKPPTSRTVLFVEDNDSIRILLRNAFERKGYRVIEARDGEEAMLQSSLHPEPIDLLISDVVMPFMDGPSLARKLSAQRPDMKVILISGCPVDPEAVSELVAGGAQFVLKPFTQRDLLAQAQRILDGK
jgi:two-component system cell cycle sensor histidine kinase/response regulator CckA